MKYKIKDEIARGTFGKFKEFGKFNIMDLLRFFIWSFSL
jgi:hypothetical protein